MSGGKLCCPVGARFFQQRAEFDLLVTQDTWVWGAALQVLTDKRGDDLLLELLLEIQHVERKAELLRHAACICNVGRRAAGVKPWRNGFTLGHLADAHSDSDDLVPGLMQEHCSQAAIHSATHGDKYSVLGISHLYLSTAPPHGKRYPADATSLL